MNARSVDCNTGQMRGQEDWHMPFGRAWPESDEELRGECCLSSSASAACSDNNGKLASDGEGHLNCAEHKAFCTDDSVLVAQGAPAGWFADMCRETCGLCASGPSPDTAPRGIVSCRLRHEIADQQASLWPHNVVLSTDHVINTVMIASDWLHNRPANLTVSDMRNVSQCTWTHPAAQSCAAEPEDALAGFYADECDAETSSYSICTWTDSGVNASSANSTEAFGGNDLQLTINGIHADSAIVNAVYMFECTDGAAPPSPPPRLLCPSGNATHPFPLAYNPIVAPLFQTNTCAFGAQGGPDCGIPGAAWLWTKLCPDHCLPSNCQDGSEAVGCVDAPQDVVQAASGFTGGCEAMIWHCNQTYFSTLLEIVCPVSCGTGCSSSAAIVPNVTVARVLPAQPNVVVLDLLTPVPPQVVESIRFEVLKCPKDVASSECTTVSVIQLKYEALISQINLTMGGAVQCGSSLIVQMSRNSTLLSSLAVTNGAYSAQVQGGLVLDGIITMTAWTNSRLLAESAFKDVVANMTSHSINSDQVTVVGSFMVQDDQSGSGTPVQAAHRTTDDMEATTVGQLGPSTGLSGNAKSNSGSSGNGSVAVESIAVAYSVGLCTDEEMLVMSNLQTTLNAPNNSFTAEFVNQMNIRGVRGLNMEGTNRPALPAGLVLGQGISEQINFVVRTY